MFKPMFPLIFQSLCGHKISFVQHFTSAHSSVIGMTFMKFVQKHVWKEHLCALQVFLCALISGLVCTRTCVQLRGNIGSNLVKVLKKKKQKGGFDT